MEVVKEVKEIGKEEIQELYSNALNTALEMELAFKLMSFRLTTQEQFIRRVGQLSDYNSELFNKITQDDTASWQMATK